MSAVDEAIALLRRRPGAAAMFMRPSVSTIISVVHARGVQIHGEDGTA